MDEEGENAGLLLDYGYLLYCHGRYSLRQAVARYERAIELQPDNDKVHYQLIGALAGLGEPEWAVADYEQRLAAARESLSAYRLLAMALLAARDRARAPRSR